MTIFGTMTGRQRSSVVVSVLWVLLGVWTLATAGDRWVGVGWIVLGVLALAHAIWQARKDARAVVRDDRRDG
jgi:hypothetical protein